jgi:1-deoxy-D-xylulose-5-phosphate reductoisomerase
MGFLEMSVLVERCLEKIPYIKNPTYEDYVQTDRETRVKAFEFLK